MTGSAMAQPLSQNRRGQVATTGGPQLLDRLPSLEREGLRTLNGLRSLVAVAQDYLNGRVGVLMIGDGGCRVRVRPSGPVRLLAEYVAFCYTHAFWQPNPDWQQLEEVAAGCRRQVVRLGAGSF